MDYYSSTYTIIFIQAVTSLYFIERKINYMLIMKLEVNEVQSLPSVLREIEIGENLEDLQREVQGRIEFSVINKKLESYGIDTIINEEGKFENLGTSLIIVDKDNTLLDCIKGNIIFAGVDNEGETISLTEEQKDIIKDIFSKEKSMYTTINPGIPKEIAQEGSIVRVLPFYDV